jgi:hypothetical protein
MALNDQYRLNFILSELGIGQQTLADKLGIPVHKVKSIKIGKVKISPEIAVLIEEKFNFSFKWLLTGKGEPYLNPARTPGDAAGDQFKEHGAPHNVIDIDHGDVIRRFRDKPYARDLNMCLVELERLSPEAYKKVGSYIKGVVDGVRMVSGDKLDDPQDRRQSKRRVQEHPDKIPDQDRRDGNDRRKAGNEK